MNRQDMEYRDALLLLAADAVDDLERARIAMENRVRALEQEKGITEGPELARAKALCAATADLEHRAILDLKRAVREHYLGDFIRGTVGVGEKQGARLLGAIGNPRWNDLHGRPRRGVAELWAYCGYHVVDGYAPRRARGQKANWSAQAKMRAFLVAESCMKKMASPYRPVYDAARAKHADAVHAGSCVRCGPAGHPAVAGSPLSDGHKHARAVREVAKAILRDMYLATPATGESELPLAA